MTHINTKILFGLSQKSDGHMNFKLDKMEATKNRNTFFEKIGIDPTQVVSAQLVHGENIQTVTHVDAGKDCEATDALITTDPSICLALTVCDCLPIYLYDTTAQVVGLVHAGWRGVLNRITQKTIQKMITDHNTTLQNIQVNIGPHIRPCHFEVKSDVADQFQTIPNVVQNRNNQTFIDLSQAIKIQLAEIGLNQNNITDNPTCTYCDERYFSYRRDKQTIPEPQIAYIKLDNKITPTNSFN